MQARQLLKTAGLGAMAGGAIAATGYAALVVFNRAAYGDAKSCAAGAKDSVLDQFIAVPEVAEHHHIDIHAPADAVMAAAKALELMPSRPG